jgi:hypothetical protein
MYTDSHGGKGNAKAGILMQISEDFFVLTALKRSGVSAERRQFPVFN